ncbi:hypothetical protein ANN_14434 [Periplaneta americana]|uniref:Uncharacterized protein n=1 Tax=Periplaneta americana TaxID=6978 RepID=A0ABQ8SWA9_PERAM|nr:hypothetical protein ANN_14434 [Periplaneta americana]
MSAHRLKLDQPRFSYSCELKNYRIFLEFQGTYFIWYLLSKEEKCEEDVPPFPPPEEPPLPCRHVLINRDGVLRNGVDKHGGHVIDIPTWTLRRSEEKRIEAFEMWIWRRIELVKWAERIRNEAVLERVNEERIMLKLIRYAGGSLGTRLYILCFQEPKEEFRCVGNDKPCNVVVDASSSGKLTKKITLQVEFSVANFVSNFGTGSDFLTVMLSAVIVVGSANSENSNCYRFLIRLLEPIEI